MTVFWKNWLRAWCVAVGLFGVVLLGGAFPAADAPTLMFYGLVAGRPVAAFDGLMGLTVAVLGAVMIGWSLTLAAVFQAALRLGRDSATVWRLAVVSVTVWYAVDSLVSVIRGFWLNAASNTVLLAAFLLPVLRSGVLRNSSP